MPIYKVQFICDECGETHPTLGVFNLDDGPAVKASICDAYRETELPPAIEKLHRTKFACPTTGRETRQADDGQIFLVRLAAT